jgi:hypothetical protein
LKKEKREKNTRRLLLSAFSRKVLNFLPVMNLKNSVVDLSDEWIGFGIGRIPSKQQREEQLRTVFDDDDFSQEENDEDDDELKTDLDRTVEQLDSHLQKAIRRIYTHVNNKKSKADVINDVINYCYENPKIKSVPKIVKDILENNGDYQNEVLFLNDEVLGDDENDKKQAEKCEIFIESQDLPEEFRVHDEVIEVEKEINPLVEIMKIFPNAKRSSVSALLAANNNDYYHVIDTMFEKGYEKEENLSVKRKKIEDKYDFKSSSWITTDGTFLTFSLFSAFHFFLFSSRISC